MGLDHEYPRYLTKAVLELLGRLAAEDLSVGLVDELAYVANVRDLKMALNNLKHLADPLLRLEAFHKQNFV